MAGWYKQPVQYGRESTHKSRAARAPSSLGDYMYKIHHINNEENMLISGNRERSAFGDYAEPKQFLPLVYPTILTYTK
jgi:hypothetical protein